jgi:hypothetical protein
LVVDDFVEKMMEFYQVFTINELSKEIGISQQAVSKWKKNNSITAVKKKCRELGIYNEIFGDLNTNTNNQIIGNNHGNLSQTGSIHAKNQKDDNNLNIDEAVFAIFKKAYAKCINENNELDEDKINELILYLMKFK